MLYWVGQKVIAFSPERIAFHILTKKHDDFLANLLCLTLGECSLPDVPGSMLALVAVGHCKLRFHNPSVIGTKKKREMLR